MAKKHKHEEHVNHERWVISYADMVTLLFALFVVLYAIGETKLKKLVEVSKSIAFALNYEGEGKTQEEGIFDRGEVGGELMEPIPLLTAQKGPMKEFLLDTLPEAFEEQTGKSLEIVISDDTIAFTGPMSAFFVPGRDVLRPELTAWVGDMVASATAFMSNVRVNLRAPDVQISQNADRTMNRTSELCHRRNEHLLQILSRQPQVNPENVTTEFRFLPPTREAWEDVGTVTLAFASK